MTTLREAVANLIKVKGRHNTEIAYQKLVEAFDADEPEVCCQDFEKCVRSCTPRGQWIAHVRCGCGDQIMPDDGAECGNCVAARNTVKPEQEPQEVIAKWIKANTEHREWYICPKCSHQTPRFKDEWQGLTDDELHALHYELKCAAMGATSILGMYRILEKALKEKNND